MSAVTSSSKLDPVVYREGMLLKRQRGLKTGNAKKLKFQERFCRLTCTSLDYYDPNPKKRVEGPKGQFAVEQIKVAEAMEKELFGKEFAWAFQIGDNTEVMYFVAKSQGDMDEWLAACRHVAKDAGNTFLSHHHHGVFGLVNKGRWSCCANPRRACPGCSPATVEREAQLTSTIPLLRTTPPSQRSPRTPTPTNLHRSYSPATPRSTTPNFELDTTSKDSDSEEEPTFSPPKIRRFTLADPLFQPLTPKRTKKTSQSEKEGEVGDEGKKEEHISQEDKNNSLNSLCRGELGEGSSTNATEDSRKTELIELAKGGSGGVGSTDRDNEKANKISKEKGRDENRLKAEDEQRKGASSPSPSVDSGRGVSRPNSQIDVVDLRVSRTESVGKKSVQSVVSEPGATAPADTGKKHTLQLAIQEENDGPSKQDKQAKQVEKSSEGSESEEKYQDPGSHPSSEDDIKSPTLSTGSSLPLRSPLRKLSSPPAPEITYLKRSVSPEANGRPRRHSHFLEESRSELTQSVTPQHRKLLASMAGANSPKQERPQSILQSSVAGASVEAVQTQPVSKLHQACKDGNLQMLEEELNKVMMVNLEEPVSTPIPYTPLFLAYLNEHYQVMSSLLAHGANPNCEEPCEQASLLQWASEKGCTDIMDLLIKYKADVNKRDGHGNTPLMMACKNGHFEAVELLLENGANVDEDSKTQRTALHEATEGGHTDITELLLKQTDIDPTARDDQDHTPYDIAYSQQNGELMQLLQVALPKEVRPYALKVYNTEAASQMINTLLVKGEDTLVTGSRDCCVKFFNTSDLSERSSLRLTDTVLDMSTSHTGSHLILGSTSVQLLDMEAPEKRRILADDTQDQDDENLLDPPLHLVHFGPKGRMVTASVEGCLAKLWPPISQNTGHMAAIETTLHVGEDRSSVGCIYSLAMSPDPNSPWLAVGLQPGRIGRPEGNKLVYCYDMDSKKLHQIFDAGDGGLGVAVALAFPPDGKTVAIGCSEHLSIWEIKTGNLLQKFTTSSSTSVLSLCYSPSGKHLAAGLSSGEIQVFEIQSSSPIFFLPPTSDHSPVTAIAYSSCGKLFGSGHTNGTLRLWEA